MVKKPIDIKVTKEGLEKLKKEQEDLLLRRPGVLVRMVAAREQGDLSENAGFHAAKEELGKIDSRVRELKLMIRFADIIESTGSGVVGLGSKVVVDDGSIQREFMIVGVTEANPLDGKLSEKSPIGGALLGKSAGDSVEVAVPDGKVTFKVIGVS